MINLLLLILSIALTIPLGIVGFVYSVISRMLKAASIYFWKCAVAMDELGNTLCMDLFNDLMVKPDGHRFGNSNETVSPVLGVNKKAGKLYWLGLALSYILHLIDKFHVEKAADNEQ